MAKRLFVAGILMVVCTYCYSEIITVPAGLVPHCMCVLDTGDGVMLIAGGLDKNEICAVTLDGKELWRYKTEGMPFAIDTGDLDGDGKKEVVATICTLESKIIILDQKGTLIKEISPEVIICLLKVADINNDKKDEIVVSGYMGKVLAYNNNGEKILDNLIDDKNFHRVAIEMDTGDIDGDGDIDIVYQPRMNKYMAIDASGNSVPTRGKPICISAFRECRDMNGDGKAELIRAPELAGADEVIVEGSAKTLWSAKLTQTKAELDAEADGIKKWTNENFIDRKVKTGNFTKDEGIEIASFCSDGDFNLLNKDGKNILKTRTRYPFMMAGAGDIDNDGLDEFLVSRAHYQNIYVIKFDDKTADEIKTLMSSDSVTDNLDNILTQIDSIKTKKVRAKSEDNKLHVLFHVDSHHVSMLKDWIPVVNRKISDMCNENVEYAWLIRYEESGLKYDTHGGAEINLALLKWPQDRILKECKGFEEKGIKFFAVVSHFGLPIVGIDTCKKMLEIAPNSCLGFGTLETIGNYPSEVWPDFLSRMDELAKLCVKHKKKILFGEEAPFWLTMVSDPKARATLLKPEYKSVLVPVLKTIYTHCNETDISAYIGSVMAGEIDAWGITAEEDFWPAGYETTNLGGIWTCPDDIIMRHELLATALGAKYITIEACYVYDIYFEPVDNNFKEIRVSREAKREQMIWELFNKGILGPVRPEDILTISPTAFHVSKDPEIDKQKPKFPSFGMHRYNGTGFINDSNLDFSFNPSEYSLSKNLYGCKKMYNGLFPNNPFGTFAIFGPDVKGIKNIDTYFDINGRVLFKDGKEIPAKEAIDEVKGAFEKAASKLPFTADGVFISARRDEENAYQVILMDTELFGPVDINTEVVTTINGLTCTDEITGEEIPVNNNKAKVTVKAGCFRLLRFEKK